ncbi:hypothetical protein BGW38_010177 [Lunasporangiospora selenospora]|uniref:Uncharacterized protein n=1 Tax=Lunasporangiospora selenospora TaxID=979761 RepID=A0A9P6KIB6_9FUNG|nr:hypothetical protein BGW38_010177 [Lunasporangiospora selenospora]
MAFPAPQLFQSQDTGVELIIEHHNTDSNTSRHDSRPPVAMMTKSALKTGGRVRCHWGIFSTAISTLIATELQKMIEDGKEDYHQDIVYLFSQNHLSKIVTQFSGRTVAKAVSPSSGLTAAENSPIISPKDSADHPHWSNLSFYCPVNLKNAHCSRQKMAIAADVRRRNMLDQQELEEWDEQELSDLDEEYELKMLELDTSQDQLMDVDAPSILANPTPADTKVTEPDRKRLASADYSLEHVRESAFEDKDFTDKELSVVMSIVNCLRPYVPRRYKAPDEENYRQYTRYNALDAPLILISNAILGLLGHKAYTRKICPHMATGRLHGLLLGAPQLFEPLCNKKPCHFDIFDVRDQPLTNGKDVTSPESNKARVFKSFIDWHKLEKTCAEGNRMVYINKGMVQLPGPQMSAGTRQPVVSAYENKIKATRGTADTGRWKRASLQCGLTKEEVKAKIDAAKVACNDLKNTMDDPRKVVRTLRRRCTVSIRHQLRIEEQKLKKLEDAYAQAKKGLNFWSRMLTGAKRRTRVVATWAEDPGLVKMSENLSVTIPEIQAAVNRFHVLESLEDSDVDLPLPQPRTQEEKKQIRMEARALKLPDTITITARQLNEVSRTRKLVQVRQDLLKHKKNEHVKQALDSISTADASFANASTISAVDTAQSARVSVTAPLRDFNQTRSLIKAKKTLPIFSRRVQAALCSTVRRQAAERVIQSLPPQAHGVASVDKDSGYCSRCCRFEFQKNSSTRFCHPDYCTKTQPDVRYVGFVGAVGSAVGSRLGGHAHRGGKKIRAEHRQHGVIGSIWNRLREFFTSGDAASFSGIDQIADIQTLAQRFQAEPSIEDNQPALSQANKAPELAASSTSSTSVPIPASSAQTPKFGTASGSGSSGSSGSSSSSTGTLSQRGIVAMKAEFNRNFTSFRGEAWKLSSGACLDDIVAETVLEDVLVKQERTNLVNTNEQNYLRCFDKEPAKIKEMLAQGWHHVNEEDDQLPDEAFREAAHIALLHLHVVYRSTQFRLPEAASESFYLQTLWRFLNALVLCDEMLSFRPAEAHSQASALRKNRDRRLEGSAKQAVGREVDGLVVANKTLLELCVLEAARKDRGPNGYQGPIGYAKTGKSTQRHSRRHLC